MHIKKYINILSLSLLFLNFSFANNINLQNKTNNKIDKKEFEKFKIELNKRLKNLPLEKRIAMLQIYVNILNDYIQKKVDFTRTISNYLKSNKKNILIFRNFELRKDAVGYFLVFNFIIIHPNIENLNELDTLKNRIKSILYQNKNLMYLINYFHLGIIYDLYDYKGNLVKELVIRLPK